MKTSAADILHCPLRKHWISFRLVDEHGDGSPYAGLAFRVRDSQGQVFEETLGNDGFAQIRSIHCGPAFLELAGIASTYRDAWHEELSSRKAFQLPLANIQVAAEKTPSGPRRSDGKTYLAEARAREEGARFYRVEVSDFAEATGHLPAPDMTWGPRPPALLKRNASQVQNQPGIALAPNSHYVLEVKALRAYRPLLSTDKAFCAVNAYHLAVMSTFAYAPFGKSRTPGTPYVSSPPPYLQPGSIGNVLREQLACLDKAQLFNTATYNLLYEEVPYSKRLEVMPYDPERYQSEAANGWATPEEVHFLYDDKTETQAFISHNDRLVLISVRGTQEELDILRDLDARQVPYEEGEGQAHRGFYYAFQSVKKFVERYMRAFHLPEHSVIVCGHSLGGAIALLLSEWLRRAWTENVVLYTFGAPRAADRAFVQAASGLTHHRLVNHNDPIPGVPFVWMDAEWKLAAAGVVALFSAPAVGISLLLGGLLNLEGDPYEHHGEQRHFVPRKPGGGSESAVLWRADCALIEDQACARYCGALNLQDDMPQRAALIDQLASAAEHSSDSGYSRAMLTTLLRWHAGVTQRDGALFTPDEIQDIQSLIRRAEEELASWQPRSFAEFRHEIRKRHDRRFYNKTDAQLLQLYNEGITAVRRLTARQRDALDRARQRLLSEADRPLTAEDVLGELWRREDVPALVSDWLALDANREAARLAAQDGAPRPAFV